MSIESAEDRAAWMPQSLASGTVGTALLHVERAHHDGDWATAHALIKQVTQLPVSAADKAGLYLGAPAVTFLLHAAARGSTTRYRQAVAELERHVTDLAHRRVTAASMRILAGRLPEFGEYDVFYGLTGIGALLLDMAPGGSATERVLRYIVGLTRPLRVGDHMVPGWWVGHDPGKRRSKRFRAGHANFGAAHGIPGPLALLALAARQGITVEGHHEAMRTILDWLDQWQQDDERGSWWPETVNLAEHSTGHATQSGPSRPSWCYGTPGIARVGQLAAIALDDGARRRTYEDALAASLDDPAQLAQIVDTGICHGWAGIYQTVWHAARDAVTDDLTQALPRLEKQLRNAATGQGDSTQSGFLTGSPGTRLALLTADHDEQPRSRWDACLLIA